MKEFSVRIIVIRKHDIQLITILYSTEVHDGMYCTIYSTSMSNTDTSTTILLLHTYKVLLLQYYYNIVLYCSTIPVEVCRWLIQ